MWVGISLDLDHTISLKYSIHDKSLVPNYFVTILGKLVTNEY